MTLWFSIHGMVSDWMVLLRVTDYVHHDTSSWRGRPFLLKHYNYRSYNYMRYNFASRYSTNHYYQTPNGFFGYQYWYYTIVTVDYE